MTHALAIARREVEERVFVMVAAIAMALIPFVALVFPNASWDDRKGLLVTTGFLIAVAFTWALGLILGTTLVGRELSEKRLSFYFSRPVSGTSIWFGKLIAASALLVASFAIVNAIPLGLGGRIWETMSTQSRGVVAAAILAIAFALMLAAHVVSTWIRSRSPILALDFVGVLVFAAVLLACIVPLVFVQPADVALTMLAFAAVALVLAILGGGAWQLVRGRVDPRRSHRELSRFLWTAMAVVLVVIAGYARWVLNVTPRDLRGPANVMQQGSVIHLIGASRGSWAGFFVDLNNGSYIQTPARAEGVNGDSLAWVAPSRTIQNAITTIVQSREVRDFTLTVVRFESKPVIIAELPLTSSVGALSVQADASQVAYIADGVLAVYDTRTKKSIAAKLPIEPRGGNSKTVFLGNGIVRACLPELRGGAWVLNVYDFDTNARRWHEAMTPVPLVSGFRYRAIGTRIITDPRRSWMWMMHDGRSAIASPWDTHPAKLEIRRGDVLERTIPLPWADGAIPVAEIGRGRLLVTTRSRRAAPATYVIDANAGAIGAPMKDVVAPIDWSGFGVADAQPRLHALLHEGTGRIDVIDTASGAIRPLY
jgi:ABC-type transport system involved in multi-copper enzyme maturation permease subunit